MRYQAVQEILGGAPYPAVAKAYGAREGTVRQWVKRHLDAHPGARTVPAPVPQSTPNVPQLAPPVDLSKLPPLEVLEHDIAEARRDLTAARQANVHTAIAPQRNQLRRMEDEARQLRTDAVEEAKDKDEDIATELIELMRVKKWVRLVWADRQCRLAINSVQATTK